VYAAWSEQADDANGNPAGPIALKLTHSGDGGQHWSTPVSVNAKGVNSAVLPWIVARGPGQVDLVYVGSSTTHNPDDATANWYALQAQTSNGTAAAPSFTTSALLANPVRYGEVCMSGIVCSGQGDDGRSLLDFISIDLASTGCAFAAVPSSANEAYYPNKSVMVTQTFVARQTKGCLR